MSRRRENHESPIIDIFTAVGHSGSFLLLPLKQRGVEVKFTV
jgi:hypothetical protein